ncbi:MAG TPA: T9SS type A sorting domain-containing protein [Flavobacteriales bacterium]|nr:T9SS type A sorting domain-containing protein [Flavobacteriales bacterium]HNU55289.1 T9SS type A sorting domain-containing protein [Flavobacteriales bacterium]
MERSLLSCLFLVVQVVQAQNEIPNAGFEQWSGSAPVSWSTSNIPGSSNPVTQSSDAIEGSSSARGEVVLAPNGSSPFPPVLLLGVTPPAVSVTQSYTAFTGMYKLAPVGDDEMLVEANLFDATSQLVAIASAHLPAAASWTSFSVPFDYDMGSSMQPPASLQMVLTVENGVGSAATGTVFLVDDLALAGGTIGIDEGTIDEGPVTLYPNPSNGRDVQVSWNDLTTRSFVVTDIAGRVIHRTTSSNSGIHLPSSTWAPGMHLLSIQEGDDTRTLRLLITD